MARAALAVVVVGVMSLSGCSTDAAVKSSKASTATVTTSTAATSASATSTSAAGPASGIPSAASPSGIPSATSGGASTSSALDPQQAAKAVEARDLQNDVSLTDPDMHAIVRGDVVVLGTIGTARLANVATDVDDLAGRVRDRTSSTTRPLLVLVPATEAEFTAWTGGESTDNEDGITFVQAGVDPFVVLSPSVIANTDTDTTAYRRFVIAHELVHAYTQPAQTLRLWVGEGYAQMVAGELTESDYGADDIPMAAHLPKDAEFTAEDPRTAADAYWLASDFFYYLASQWSLEECTAFYTAANSSSVEAAFQKVFKRPLSAVTADWVKSYEAAAEGAA
ncbi:hypothetical protein G9U51_04365 [Calidifontibacter sp. DB0510]|uniref:Peptidase MA-like domain-containing protein n=1 Tax=Metallococcus carri TaxID=1656884 RepID=A0A967E9B2_9MICO|nr:hypothetical protein [Metallococcus carri]NHN55020.1 hypothetical protein [Metallococcus carri]NOP37366.1 hypothetical protein [Calidifontibacter sp. DB2511S]